MSKLFFVIPIVIAAIFASSCTSKKVKPLSYQTYDILTNSEQKAIPAVRLHDASTGKFFCSGTVISHRMVLTAAHCLETGGAVNIRPYTAKDFKNVSKQFLINHQLDVAIIIGNFSMYNVQPVLTSPNKLIMLLDDPEATFVVCGYPLGGALFCNQTDQVQIFGFGTAGSSPGWPGMSGGPVINANTGLIIGVMSAMSIKFSIYGSTVNLMESFGVPVE